jgi:hypothetical protein
VTVVACNGLFCLQRQALRRSGDITPAEIVSNSSYLLSNHRRPYREAIKYYETSLCFLNKFIHTYDLLVKEQVHEVW